MQLSAGFKNRVDLQRIADTQYFPNFALYRKTTALAEEDAKTYKNLRSQWLRPLTSLLNQK